MKPSYVEVILEWIGTCDKVSALILKRVSNMKDSKNQAIPEDQSHMLQMPN